MSVHGTVEQAPSSSDAMQDLYRTYAVKLGELEQKFSAPADCNAAAFVIAGRIIGTDFFDKADALRKLWQKLVRSCSIDALELATEGAESIAPQEISKWLKSSASAPRKSHFRHRELAWTYVLRGRM